MATPRRATAVRRLLAVVLLSLAAGACGTPENLFVLLDNPDGKVGSIRITNAGGERVLDKPGQASGVYDADSAPTEPVALEEERIQEVFGATFATQPKASATFILYFRTGTTELTEESKKKVREVLDDVRDRPFPVIAVIGHTDRYGSARNNFTLGLERAQSVADLLVQAGADPKLIEVSSHGENNPLVPTEDQDREPRNRRVEISVR